MICSRWSAPEWHGRNDCRCGLADTALVLRVAARVGAAKSCDERAGDSTTARSLGVEARRPWAGWEGAAAGAVAAAAAAAEGRTAAEGLQVAQAVEDMAGVAVAAAVEAAAVDAAAAGQDEGGAAAREGQAARSAAVGESRD